MDSVLTIINLRFQHNLYCNCNNFLKIIPPIAKGLNLAVLTLGNKKPKFQPGLKNVINHIQVIKSQKCMNKIILIYNNDVIYTGVIKFAMMLSIEVFYNKKFHK